MNRKGINCKVVMLGDTSVGKSCLTLRFVRNVYYEFQEPTIGAAFLAKTFNFQDKQIKLEIWDTAGQERYRSLAPMYYRGAKAAIVVYDITQKDTLNGAKSWIKELRTKEKSCVIILVGNKFDLSDKRTVDINLVKEYAVNQNLIYFESSAKTGHNVQEIFKAICKRVHYKPPEQIESIVVHPEITTQQSSTKNCC